MGSSHKNSFRKWISELYEPCVVCASTDTVARVCGKNGLSLSELLQPFGVLQNASIPIRTVNKSYSLRNYRFRFCSVEECAALPAKVCDAYLERVVAEGANDGAHFSRFKTALFLSLRHQRTHMLDHPLAYLIAVTTEDAPNAAHWFELLQREENMPAKFQAGTYDPNISKYYLVIHDRSSEGAASVDVANVQQQIKRLFGDRCFFLELNSLSPAEANMAQPDIWSPYFPVDYSNFRGSEEAKAERGVLGRLLSPEDLKSIQTFVEGLAFDGILRDTEKRMLQLNQHVATMRKGFRNQLRMLWRKPKDAPNAKAGAEVKAVTANDGGAHVYTYDTIESQVQMLADLAFLVQDYEMALGLYRIVREDYGADKAFVHRACVYELMCVCLFLTEGSKKQIQEYTQKCIADLTQQKASRLLAASAIIFGDILKSSNDPEQFKKASEIFLKASVRESTLVASMLLEQAGNCILMSGLPQATIRRLENYENTSIMKERDAQESTTLRKYCFRMVAAGALFKEAGVKAQAIRCYKQAKKFYTSDRWFRIRSHVDLSIGSLMLDSKQEKSPSVVKELLYLWADVLLHGKLPAYKQETILKDFLGQLQLLNDMSTHTKPWSFHIPTIVDQSLSVTVQHNASILPDAFAHTPSLDKKSQAEWEELRRLQSAPTVATSERCAHVGEPIFVDFRVQNPLLVAIELAELRLRLQVEKSEGTEEQESQSSIGLTLAPLEERWVRLRYTPETTGRVNITAVSYKLFKIGRFARFFEMKGRLLNDTREHRVSRARSPDLRLQLNVVEQGAWIGAELKGLPQEISRGQVVSGELELINNGVEGCEDGILLSTCLNGLYISATPLEDVLDEGDSSDMPLPSLDEDGKVYKLPVDTLEPGLPVTFRISFRVPDVAKELEHSFKLLFRYKNSEGRYRSLSYEVPVNVRKGVSCSTLSRPSASGAFLAVSLANDLERSISVSRVTISAAAHQVIDCSSGMHLGVDSKGSRTWIYALKSLPKSNSVTCVSFDYKGKDAEVIEQRPWNPFFARAAYIAREADREAGKSANLFQIGEIPEHDPSFVHVAVEWTARDVYGQLYGFGVDMHRKATLEAAWSVPANVSHDFTQGALCLLPVSLLLTNTSEEEVESCEVEFLTQNHHGQFIAGKIKQRLSGIKPGASAKACVQLGVVKAGKYCVDPVAISCSSCKVAIPSLAFLVTQQQNNSVTAPAAPKKEPLVQDLPEVKVPKPANESDEALSEELSLDGSEGIDSEDAFLEELEKELE